jgi:hypothetical protein
MSPDRIIPVPLPRTDWLRLILALTDTGDTLRASAFDAPHYAPWVRLSLVDEAAWFDTVAARIHEEVNA